MKTSASHPTSLGEWLAQHAAVAKLLGEDVVLPSVADPALVPTLTLLQHLRVDSDTLAATLAHELQLAPEKLPPSLQALVDVGHAGGEHPFDAHVQRWSMASARPGGSGRCMPRRARVSRRKVCAACCWRSFATCA